LKIGVFIPIRLDSERLPGKILMEVNGRPILYHLFDRILISKFISDKKCIVVCTTKKESDNLLVATVERYGASVFRGSQNDLINRFYNANKQFQFDYILQIDGDDPLISYEYCSKIIEEIITEKYDAVITEGLPFGLNTKVFTKNALNKVFESYISKNNDTGFGLYFTQSNLLNVHRVFPESDKHSNDEVRLTLDYKEDYELIRHLIEKIESLNDFSINCLIDILERNSNLIDINFFRQEENIKRSSEKIFLKYKDKSGKESLVKY